MRAMRRLWGRAGQVDRQDRVWAARCGWLVGLMALIGCAASHHPTEMGDLGQPTSTSAMLERLGEPGPIRFERVVAADWAVARSGLINLDHPRAVAAGIEDGSEPIQIYFYVLEHPVYGRYIVDSGLEAGFVGGEPNPRLSFIVRKAMDTGALAVHVTTGDWIEAHGGIDGVFLTHLHLDHIMGLPDIGRSAPVYAGPGETRARDFMNAFTRGSIDGLLETSGPLREWPFEADPSGRFEGVLDIFGDGSLYALHVPGHSPGSTAFAVRSIDGPVLLVGDASHTRWGWENDVEPGTFSLDQPESARSLARLRELAAQVPGIEVHLGHQEMPRSRVAAAWNLRPASGGR